LQRSFNEDVPPASDRQTEWWSPIDDNNVVDLDRPRPVPALAVKKEEYSSPNFKFGLDDGDVDAADNTSTLEPSTASFNFFHILIFILQTLYKFEQNPMSFSTPSDSSYITLI
jgi:hypothetical protein